jgi:hypothetical protein
MRFSGAFLVKPAQVHENQGDRQKMKAPYIVPIDVGDMEWDHSEALYRQGIRVKIKGKFICWYIGGTDVPILVDSGFPTEERAKKWHSYTNPTLSSDQQIGNALKKRGIDPGTIKIFHQDEGLLWLCQRLRYVVGI